MRDIHGTDSFKLQLQMVFFSTEHQSAAVNLEQELPIFNTRKFSD